MLDGGWDFTATLNGAAPTALELRPSEYFRRQVRVSSFSYEQPARLAAKSGDLFMCCSDYPHSEGTATPIEDYARQGCSPDEAPGLFRDNVAAPPRGLVQPPVPGVGRRRGATAPSAVHRRIIGPMSRRRARTPERYDGEMAVVTGASSGIGRRVAFDWPIAAPR